jgi:hypothetical protein
MKFEKLNLNPKGVKACDCVIRSIAFATNQSWDTVYLALSEIGLKMKRVPNEKKVYEKYLEQLGWVKHKQPRDYNNHKITVENFLSGFELMNNLKDGERMIMSMPSHLSACEWLGYEMKLVDTWNCSQKNIGNYWTKE